MTLFLLLLLVGCEAKFKPVEGTITLDGAPLQSGYLMFYADGGKGREGSARIKDGKFVGELLPGRNLIKVKGYEKLETPIADPGLDGATVSRKQVTSDKLHWDNPDLIVEVTGSRVDIQLVSGPSTNQEKP